MFPVVRSDRYIEEIFVIPDFQALSIKPCSLTSIQPNKFLKVSRLERSCKKPLGTVESNISNHVYNT